MSPARTGPGPLVHGLGSAPATPDWPALTLDELTPVLAGYAGAPHPREILWTSPRPYSAAAQVRTDHGSCFVKRHDEAVRSLTDLAVEHAFAAHLRSAGAPLPAPWRRPDGSTALALGRWTYEVASPGAGVDRYRDAPSWTAYRSTADAGAAGRALGAFHRAATGFDAPARDTSCLLAAFDVVGSADPPAAAERFVAARPLLAAALPAGWRDVVAGVLEPWWPRLAPLLDDLPAGWSHGDWHGSNLLWAGGRVQTVLDLGLADRGTPVHDLATALERATVDWIALAEGRPVTVALDQARALLDGYCTERPLSPVERAALPLVLPMVHVEYALTELAYFHGVTRDPAACALAWDGYLQGHAAWWRDEGGQQMLAALVAVLR